MRPRLSPGGPGKAIQIGPVERKGSPRNPAEAQREPKDTQIAEKQKIIINGADGRPQSPHDHAPPGPHHQQQLFRLKRNTRSPKGARRESKESPMPITMYTYVQVFACSTYQLGISKRTIYVSSARISIMSQSAIKPSLVTHNLEKHWMLAL
jgi:hypothetical protein